MTTRTIPCGKCLPCLERKRADWSFRIRQEWKISVTALFITLTYNDENLLYTDKGKTSLLKLDFQNFMKRLRKNQPNQLRYYAVGEYGSNTDRPHYHMILFNLLNPSNVQKAWDKGFVKLGSVTDASIHYTTKYLINQTDKKENRELSFALMSRNPGIGSNYLETATDYHLKGLSFAGTQAGGIKQALPRYYIDKIFTKKQKLAQKELQIKLADQIDTAYMQKLKDQGDDYGTHQLYKQRALDEKRIQINKKEKL